MGKLTNELIDGVMGLSETRPAKKFSEYPVIRRFLATPYKSSNSEQIIRGAYEEQEKLYNAFKLTGEKSESLDLRKYTQYKNAVNALGRVYKAEKIVINDKTMTPDQKRQILDELNKSRVNISRRALGRSRVQ
ncbi:hypothetical protein BCB69_01600 [Dialister pneumosintes]|uniref:Uncharacterized protein n=2 Tax=Dialister pneumosintes TaxID=39950 RepID=A0A1B3WCU8_9FIRM|nr:hypothetical protein BCB69_01600 [Dialister pneumosintes]